MPLWNCIALHCVRYDGFDVVDTIVAPSIERLVVEKDAVEGEETILYCKASGTRAPIVTWFDPQKRNLSTVGGYVVDRDHGLLTINKVRRIEDNGLFTCLAENAAGHEERTLNVTVITKPIVTSFENMTHTQTTNAVFECRAIGLPHPRLTIRKDGEDRALYQGKDRVLIEERHFGDETVLQLTLSNVQRSDDGLYYCSAENAGGKVDKVGHLSVEFAPDLRKTASEYKTWESNPVNLTCVAEGKHFSARRRKLKKEKKVKAEYE